MEIVFIHFNSRIPIHLFMNLQRTVRIFPNVKVVLISNRAQFIPANVKFELFTEDQDWKNLFSRISHPRNFRHNFWFTSLSRLQVLAKYQISSGVPILHIESDVIISDDFPLKEFEKHIRNIAFPILSLDRGIASILYLPNSEASNLLLEHIELEASQNSNTTDMLVLGSIYKKSNPISILPIGPVGSQYYRDFTPEEIFEEWEQGIATFKGVFDGWDVGGYFFGTDPRNARGKSFVQRQVPSEFADVQSWTLAYSDDRHFLNLVTRTGQIPIYCLHLTSKNLFLFKRSSKKKNYSKFLIQKGEYSLFYPRIFMTQAFFALIRRLRERI